jgi:hypothetical protein
MILLTPLHPGGDLGPFGLLGWLLVLILLGGVLLAFLAVPLAVCLLLLKGRRGGKRPR